MRLKEVRSLLPVLLLPCLLAGQVPEIGIVDFYGLRKVSEERVHTALGVKPGDSLPSSKEGIEVALEEIPGVVRARLEAACCEDGKAILYVGIEEKGAPHFDFRPPAEELALLPEEIHDSYVHFLAAVGQAVRDQNTEEDLTNGHSLMADPDCRAQQERFLTQAAEHLEVIRDALRRSFDAEHRAIAAYVIGYAPKKQDVVDDLLYALRDPDDTVRNNAMRSLAAIEVLAKLKPSLGISISPTWLVEMLNSIIWTDRNTAAVNLVNLTEYRDPETLGQLRDRALPALIDMAQWAHLPHALPSFILLGRVLEMEEQDIQNTWSKGEQAVLIARARQLERQRKKK